MVIQAPEWALTFSYWVHWLATVLWVGGLLTFVLLVIPSARQIVPGNASRILIEKLQNKILQVGWCCLAFLVISGMFQMSSHPSFESFLKFDDTWSIAIFLKHVTIGGLLVVNAYITWIINPKIRLSHLHQKNILEDVNYIELAKLEKVQIRLLYFSVFLFIIIFFLTAWARSS